MSDESQYWKLLFFASFLFTSRAFFSSSVIDDVLANDETYPELSWVGYLLGGFLVGMGTELGSGCTTGHGENQFFASLFTFLKQARFNIPFFLTEAVVNSPLSFQAYAVWLDPAGGQSSQS
jgi:hypothetical protein